MKKNITPYSIGRKMESLAVCYLREHGINILRRNFYTPYGEIDIIGMEHGILVFVEVRYRKNCYYGEPLETLSTKKNCKVKTIYAMVFG